ncbi:hypothetical protein [Oceanomicrobium pacificus]|uniref:Uncharacterized protein n=1 Tax=Oceanomicrobium pacificus TaxID=2692916 RepID=A0A6B0TJ82_9RHOB|nr:hypothetical protein [Oceanomicrobium pacificus]MXU63936.1 hypothetical protein [Oceanomicrobium pacificus]
MALALPWLAACAGSDPVPQDIVAFHDRAYAPANSCTSRMQARTGAARSAIQAELTAQGRSELVYLMTAGGARALCRVSRTGEISDFTAA